MGLFNSKNKRVAQHRQLIELSRAALANLKVETYKSSEGVTEPVWTEATRAVVPLEYRWWLSFHLDTLVTAVHDTPDSELGRRDWIRELSESLSVARAVLGGLPDAARQTLRADTFARLQTNLDEYITESAKVLATDNSLLLFGMEQPLGACLDDARVALTWFQTQDALDAASALRKFPDNELRRPSLFQLGGLVESGKTVLGKVQDFGAKRKAERQRQTPG